MATQKFKKVVPYGQWSSPITAESVSTSSISLHEVLVDKTRQKIYWLESRPLEKGRYTIVEHTAEGARDVLPRQYSAHGQVNELGGGTLGSHPDGSIVFTDKTSQNVYRLNPRDSQTDSILDAIPGTRYAAFAVHPSQSQWLIAVKEDHRDATPTTQAYGVRNCLVAIDISTKQEHTIAEGDDFYAYPQFSPDGTKACWLQWTHPDMPWTGTVLHVADWVNGSLQNIREIAGQRQKESIAQPRWASDGTLFFASDKSGFWQLCKYTQDAVHDLNFKGLEKSELAIADWRLESSSYTILDPDTIVAASITHATSNLVLLDLKVGEYRDLLLPFVDLAMADTGVFAVSDNSVVVLGSTRTQAKQLALVTEIRSERPVITTLQSTMQTTIPSELFSQAQHLEITRTARSGATHAFFFPPQSTGYIGPVDAMPPVLINLHGGPNACTSPALNLSVQFWTSRGYAVCAINYSGSTGFGREYREDLTGHWGEYDALDTHDVVQFLRSSDNRLCDGTRVGVYGGSAGGYGTLRAIHMFPDLFRAAISSYGISDVAALQADSYKFESHDVERLILSSCQPGQNQAAARKALYRERSPRYHVGKIQAALLLLQGSIDVAVPKEQAYMMVDEMRRLQRTVKLVEFEGEGHGWLRQDTILQAYQEQEDWWLQHLCGVTR